MIIPVILAGGAGTRLWPMSREEKPKQFLNLSGKGTLLEETIERLKPLDPQEIVIVSSDRYKNLSGDEIRNSGLTGTVLSEPQPKNTAAAVLYAASYLKSRYDDPVMIVLPADHYIRNSEEYSRILQKGIKLAQSGSLVTIGIKPAYPETGYGYIKAAAGENRSELNVDMFVEKPDYEKAVEYCNSGDYYWNSGMFIWKVSVILEKFQQHMPQHYRAFLPLLQLSPDEIASDTAEKSALKKKIFSEIESISIDYGIMEHAHNRMLIPSDFGWADLGSWKAIDDILSPDNRGNRSPHGTGSIFIDSDNCSAYSEGSRIAVVGLSDVIVVQAGNDILVINKNESQRVRKVVDMIRSKNPLNSFPLSPEGGTS